MPPKRKAPAKSAPARQSKQLKHSPFESDPKPEPIVQSSPLVNLPSKVLDLIAARLPRKSDRLALAFTCRALWPRWKRPADWPLKIWNNHIEPCMPQEILLLRLEGAKKGQPGCLPFYVDSCKRAGEDEKGPVMLHVVEMQPQDLHRERGRTFLEWENWECKLAYEQGGRGSYKVTTHELNWDEVKEWLGAKCKCPVCDGKEEVIAGSKKIVQFLPAMKAYEGKKSIKIECPCCTRDYADGEEEEEAGEALLNFLEDYDEDDYMSGYM